MSGRYFEVTSVNAQWLSPNRVRAVCMSKVTRTFVMQLRTEGFGVKGISGSGEKAHAGFSMNAEHR